MKIVKLSVGVMGDTQIDRVEEMYEVKVTEKSYCFSDGKKGIRLRKDQLHEIDTVFHITPGCVRFHCYTTPDRVELMRITMGLKIIEELKKMLRECEISLESFGS